MDPISIAVALAQFAPSLMKFFGIGDKPVAVAQKVVDIAQTITGGKTPEEALEKMREDAQAQKQFQLAVLAIDSDLEKAYLADRASARQRDVDLAKAGRNNTRGDILAYVAVAGLLIYGVVLFFVPVPDDSRDFLIYILGALTVIVKDVYGFEYGGSKSGERSALAVQELAKKS